MPTLEKTDALIYPPSNMELWARANLKPTLASAVWTTANRAIYTPVYLPRPIELSSIRVFIGATAADNMDVGIYLPDTEGKPGARLQHSGGVAQSGVNHFQDVPLIASVIVAGLVYFAMAMNGTTGTVRVLGSMTTNLSGLILGGVFTEATAYTLPSSATPSVSGAAAAVPVLVGV